MPYSSGSSSMSKAPSETNANSSERNPSLPRNEIVLFQYLGLSVSFAAGHLNDALKNRLAHFLDGDLASNDRASVNVDDVGHAPSKFGICRQLEHRRDGISCRGAQA